MNLFVEKLHGLAAKSERRIIGLMSGTSLDGLDVALCRVHDSGLRTRVIVEQFRTIPYDPEFKKEIRQVFSRKSVDLETLCLLNKWIGRKHASFINVCLQDWKVLPSEIDLIASHGQTIYHAPLSQHHQEKFGNGTLQIGDGDHIAYDTGIITISDFRQKHIAAGGEGAPLALYGDYLLFREDKSDVILVNIGGISNFTYIPRDGNLQDLVSTDIGPGNVLMDAWIQSRYTDRNFDTNAELATKGKTNEMLLNKLLEDPFFLLPFPKTTGPEYFNLEFVQDAVRTTGSTQLPDEAILATLNELTARVISKSLLSQVRDGTPCRIYLSGGGANNPLLVDKLKKSIGGEGRTFHSTIEKGIDPDAKEAVLFALLANECVAGDTTAFWNNLPLLPAVGMGKISFPR